MLKKGSTGYTGILIWTPRKYQGMIPRARHSGRDNYSRYRRGAQVFPGEYKLVASINDDVQQLSSAD